MNLNVAIRDKKGIEDPTVGKLLSCVGVLFQSTISFNTASYLPREAGIIRYDKPAQRND